MNKKKAHTRRIINIRCKIKKHKKIRLTVYHTLRHIYAQIFEPETFKVIVSASTLEKNIYKELKNTNNKIAAMFIGKIIAQRALKYGIKEISFDRSGFKYHGKIQALAESARKYGLQF